VCTGGLVRGQ